LVLLSKLKTYLVKKCLIQKVARGDKNRARERHVLNKQNKSKQQQLSSCSRLLNLTCCSSHWDVDANTARCPCIVTFQLPFMLHIRTVSYRE